MLMRMNSKKAEFLMATVALAWGSSYLLMKNGIDPFNLIALRFGIAFVCMAFIFLPRFRDFTAAVLGKGILMGVLLFLLFTGLVFSVNHTTASTAGLLASTTVIICPDFRKRPEAQASQQVNRTQYPFGDCRAVSFDSKRYL